MKLLEKIKNDAITALKEGNKEKKLVLSTLAAEIQRNEPEIINGQKNWSDETAIKTIIKLVEANKLTGCLNENEIISVYLPQVMNKEELTTLIQNYITEQGLNTQKDMGKVMNYLKQFTGRYDAREASLITKNLLTL